MVLPELGKEVTSPSLQNPTSPEIDRETAASLNDRYLWMYTRGVEVTIADQTVVANHSKPRPSGRGRHETCRIVIGGSDQPKVLYYVTFSFANEPEHEYAQRSDEHSWAQVGKQSIPVSMMQEKLLDDFESFFGVLDAGSLLANYYTSDAYRNEQLFQQAGWISNSAYNGQHGNSGPPKYYEGYKAKLFKQSRATAAASRTDRSTIKDKVADDIAFTREWASHLIRENGWSRLLIDSVVDATVMRRQGIADPVIYRLLAKQYHPDQAEGDKASAAEVFKLIPSLFYTDGDGKRHLLWDR